MIARKRWILVALYLGLLVASHAWRTRQVPREIPDSVRVELVSAVAASGERTGEILDLAYRVWGPDDSADPRTPPVVMLHGSPGSSRDFLDLAPPIAASRRVIAPDLPGFGHSSRRAPDYSIRSHADYTLQLLDALGLETVDLLGFSMGGGFAIELAARAPERVRSLTLLSSIGVQELELLGHYELNHGLHGLQLAALWLVHEAVPHFGVLDGSMLSIEYARNFYDTDQRPLRRALERFEKPMLVLHTSRDPLVPLAAAEEHHRVVPQSRLVVLDGNHFMIFFRGEELAEPLAEFLEDVDDGTAPSRGDAEPARLEVASRPYDPRTRKPASGFSLIVVMLLIATATLVSEDLACIAAGLLVARGALGLVPAIVACLIGIVLGDVMLYWTGRLVGAKALRRAPLRWVLSEERVAESAAWLEQRGLYVILTSRFIPGTRVATYFTAGLLKTDFWKFTGFFLIASSLWAPFLVGLSSLVGQRAFDYFGAFQRHALVGLLALVAVVWIVLRIGPALMTWRGRRLIRGRVRRITRWEYWPWWIVYLPVAVWIGWLGLRHRSSSLFTLANPGIPAGGFVGESKGDLLAQMPADAVPRWERLEAGLTGDQRVERARRFLERSDVELPVVLKPDSGERGFGVLMGESWEEIESYLRETSRETLLQDFVPGDEFGVFYVRRPGDETGSVTSVTLKILPTVTGNGTSTLEHLILSDDRAVCYAHTFLAYIGERLGEIPEAGEVVRLGDLGTHWRGALFLDGNHLITPELERAVDRIARSIDGFHFGRFDVRAPSQDHLRRGEGLRVLELNGVTSEEAHIYDPRHGVLYAWRTLMAQWATAFEIGALHRERGLRPTGSRSILREVVRYHRAKSTD